MPAYNFKARFADAVESGTKRQTIRPRRKRTTKPGDTLYLYTGMRTKQCQRLAQAECKAVHEIEVGKLDVVLEGRGRLDNKETLALAQADGFQTINEFFFFFRKQYGLPFKGVLIQW